MIKFSSIRLIYLPIFFQFDCGKISCSKINPVNSLNNAGKFGIADKQLQLINLEPQAYCANCIASQSQIPPNAIFPFPQAALHQLLIAFMSCVQGESAFAILLWEFVDEFHNRHSLLSGRSLLKSQSPPVFSH